VSKLRAWRLAAQIWALSLVTLLAVILSLFVLLWTSERPSPPPGLSRMFEYIVQEVARAGEPAAIQAAVDRAAVGTDHDFALFSSDGVRVAASGKEELTPLTPERSAALQRGERIDVPSLVVVPLRVDDGFVGYGLVRLRSPMPPRPGVSTIAVVLAVLAGISLLLARRLLVPLRKLMEAAQAFGSGDVHVRVGLPPRGALGNLGQVFDEMAGRVAELLQSQRELLANVSHELRTPLARLRVALELAAESDGETARTELRLAEEDLTQLERMVEDVLKAASLDLASLRPGTSQGVLRCQRLDVAELVDRTVRRFAATSSDRRITAEAPDGPLCVHGDAELLRRALDNLLDNARKYSEAGAPIHVSTALGGNDVTITVTDAGVGIDPADQALVFTPFFRADRSRTRETGGVGLGLTLVDRIARAHGGRAVLESEPGRGTRVTLRIPRARGVGAG
jgi:two-component system OmpR family sensor kinase